MIYDISADMFECFITAQKIGTNKLQQLLTAQFVGTIYLPQLSRQARVISDSCHANPTLRQDADDS